MYVFASWCDSSLLAVKSSSAGSLWQRPVPSFEELTLPGLVSCNKGRLVVIELASTEISGRVGDLSDNLSAPQLGEESGYPTSRVQSNDVNDSMY
jgi:hypothetical protein